jgi:hypothetical protein
LQCEFAVAKFLFKKFRLTVGLADQTMARMSVWNNLAPSPPPVASVDDGPWEPGPDFGHVFIRVTDSGECIISGPPEEVAPLREQIVRLISDGRPDMIPPGVARFEIGV